MRKEQQNKLRNQGRKQGAISKERMTEIQQPTESFLRQTLYKQHKAQRELNPVASSLQGLSTNRQLRADRVRKRSNTSLPYTRKLELLTEQGKTVEQMMQDVKECRYLRNNTIDK